MERLDLTTPNFTDENIQKLSELFPNCVTEDSNGKTIDFDALKQELSSNIIEGNKERYQLTWPGKAESLVTANTPINKTLRPNREESKDFDNTENLYIEGDNLEVLKLLQETYLGKVKMIYIDPPYNTGKDFVYKDNFTQDKAEYDEESGNIDDEGGRLVSNPDSNGRYHSDWLSMMYPRLKLARNLLTHDGVIFISIGEEEKSNLEKICGEIFGNNNFRNSFIVRRHDKNINTQFAKDGLKTLNVAYEYILSYSKSNEFLFNAVYKEADKSRKSSGYWKGFWSNADRPTMRYDILGFNPEAGQWKWKEDNAIGAINNYKEYEENFSTSMTLEKYWEKTGKEKKFIKRNLNGKGKNKGVEHWIPPTVGILRNTNLLDVLATKTIPETKGLFDFPKNVDLIKIICSFSDFHKTDIILDFFSGSATTAHAIMQLNAEDNGNRKFIMTQIPETTDEKSEAYKAGYETIADIGKERIRRVGEKIKAENAGKDGINNLDIGFRVLKVDSSNMKDVYFSPDNTNQSDMFDLASNIKDDRTDEDLLFMVLLDWGVDLSVKIECREVFGKIVYFAADDFLIACFEENLDENFVKALVAEKPRKVVLRDSGFASSSVKVNVEQILKQADIEVKVI